MLWMGIIIAIIDYSEKKKRKQYFEVRKKETGGIQQA